LFGTVTNAIADFTDKSVSTGEALRNTSTNLLIDGLSVVPLLGEKYRTKAVLKSVKYARPVAAFM